ncbi:hypothetical protein FB446DRAFT_708360, partial [Lentinula raphanica]
EHPPEPYWPAQKGFLSFESHSASADIDPYADHDQGWTAGIAEVADGALALVEVCENEEREEYGVRSLGIEYETHCRSPVDHATVRTVGEDVFDDEIEGFEAHVVDVEPESQVLTSSMSNSDTCAIDFKEPLYQFGEVLDHAIDGDELLLDVSSASVPPSPPSENSHYFPMSQNPECLHTVDIYFEHRSAFGRCDKHDAEMMYTTNSPYNMSNHHNDDDQSVPFFPPSDAFPPARVWNDIAPHVSHDIDPCDIPHHDIDEEQSISFSPILDVSPPAPVLNDIAHHLSHAINDAPNNDDDDEQSFSLSPPMDVSPPARVYDDITHHVSHGINSYPDYADDNLGWTHGVAQACFDHDEMESEEFGAGDVRCDLGIRALAPSLCDQEPASQNMIINDSRTLRPMDLCWNGLEDTGNGAVHHQDMHHAPVTEFPPDMFSTQPPHPSVEYLRPLHMSPDVDVMDFNSNPALDSSAAVGYDAIPMDTSEDPYASMINDQNMKYFEPSLQHPDTYPSIPMHCLSPNLTSHPQHESRPNEYSKFECNSGTRQRRNCVTIEEVADPDAQPDPFNNLPFDGPILLPANDSRSESSRYAQGDTHTCRSGGSNPSKHAQYTNRSHNDSYHESHDTNVDESAADYKLHLRGLPPSTEIPDNSPPQMRTFSHNFVDETSDGNAHHLKADNGDGISRAETEYKLHTRYPKRTPSLKRTLSLKRTPSLKCTPSLKRTPSLKCTPSLKRKRPKTKLRFKNHFRAQIDVPDLDVETLKGILDRCYRYVGAYSEHNRPAAAPLEPDSDDGHISADSGPRPKLYEPPKRSRPVIGDFGPGRNSREPTVSTGKLLFSVSVGTVKDFKKSTHEGPTLENFVLQLDKGRRTRWNKRAAEVFSKYFRSREGYGSFRMKDVYEAFMSHLAQLKRAIYHYHKGPLGQLAQFVRHLSVDCMSGDETGSDSKFYKTTVEWRSQELTDFLNLLSAWYLSERYLGGGKYSPGELPRPRYSSNRAERVLQPDVATAQLPMNWYNPVWLMEYEERQHVLSPLPPVSLKLPDPITREAKRFLRVRRRSDLPLPPDHSLVN